MWKLLFVVLYALINLIFYFFMNLLQWPFLHLLSFGFLTKSLLAYSIWLPDNGKCLKEIDSKYGKFSIKSFCRCSTVVLESDWHRTRQCRITWCSIIGHYLFWLEFLQVIFLFLLYKGSTANQRCIQFGFLFPLLVQGHQGPRLCFLKPS